MNTDDYIQKYTLIAMAEEIQKLKEVLLNLEYGTAPSKPENRSWTEEEVLASAGLTYGE